MSNGSFGQAAPSSGGGGGTFSDDVDRLFSAAEVREGGLAGARDDLDWNTLDESVWRTLKRDVDRVASPPVDLTEAFTETRYPNRRALPYALTPRAPRTPR